MDGDLSVTCSDNNIHTDFIQGKIYAHTSFYDTTLTPRFLSEGPCEPQYHSRQSDLLESRLNTIEGFFFAFFLLKRVSERKKYLRREVKKEKKKKGKGERKKD